MIQRRRLRAAIVAICWTISFAPLAGGHIVYGRPTLLTLVGDADVVARVTVLDPRAFIAVTSTGERRPVVRVELVEVMKGAGKPGQELRFAPHGHGVAAYEAGEEALVFLKPVARSKELAALQESGLSWVSLQEDDARYVLSPESRSTVLTATRRYALCPLRYALCPLRYAPCSLLPHSASLAAA
jgi:hypothetical protein